MGLKRTVEPASLPVTLAEAKAQLRVTHSDEDTKITDLIQVATTRVENMTAESILTQTWVLTLDEFADEIELPRGPVASVTSVQYVDTDGATQTLASSEYTLDNSGREDWIVRNSDGAYPDTQQGINKVIITYVTGEDTLSNYRVELKHAILLLVAHWYDEREGMDLPPAVYTLLEPYMHQWVAA